MSDRAVSRLHLALLPREDGLWIRDLGSRNGTFLAGVKIVEARVPADATIRVGTTDIQVAYGTPAPPESLHPEASLGPLLGRSAAMREVFASALKITATDTPVLLVGEGGTGKGAFARALHDLSGRAGAAFVVVDCAALSDTVAAAEVLEDALSRAEGGTLVLDEPAQLSIALQRELVPPIEARAFRAIAMTAQDLRPLVNQGAFREGLYFRLAGATIALPSLRERTADLALLFRHFLGERQDLATPSLLDDLARLPWPDNVRELRLYAERLRDSGGELDLVPEPPDPEHEAIPTFDRAVEVPLLEDPAAATGPKLPADLEPWFSIGFKEFREKWIDLGEREYLRRLMTRTNRSSSTASREAGLERTYLYRLIKKHGV